MPGRLNVATTEVIRLRPLFWDIIDDVTVCSFSGEKSKQNKYTKVKRGKRYLVTAFVDAASGTLAKDISDIPDVVLRTTQLTHLCSVKYTRDNTFASLSHTVKLYICHCSHTQIYK